MNNDKTGQKEITLKDVHDTLKEMLKWTKFAGAKEVKPVLESKLDNDTKKSVYDLSDGTKGTRDIAKIVGSVSHGTVSNYWHAWEKVGLGESIPVMGGGNRFKHSFDLEDFGIIVPEIAKQDATTENQMTEQPTTEEPTHE